MVQEHDGGYVWREDRICELLARERVDQPSSSPAPCRIRAVSTLSSMPSSCSARRPMCCFAGSPSERPTTSERTTKNARRSSAISPRSNRFSGKRAHMKSTRLNRSLEWSRSWLRSGSQPNPKKSTAARLRECSGVHPEAPGLFHCARSIFDTTRLEGHPWSVLLTGQCVPGSHDRQVKWSPQG